jgi:hypothetical protein
VIQIIALRNTHAMLARDRALQLHRSLDHPVNDALDNISLSVVEQQNSYASSAWVSHP